jgi:hypothetical protein
MMRRSEGTVEADETQSISRVSKTGVSFLLS